MTEVFIADDSALVVAPRNGGVFHVWFHPENLYPEWPRAEEVVARFLEELGVFVRNGDLRCMTLGQLTAEFRTKLAAVTSNSSEPYRSKEMELLA